MCPVRGQPSEQRLLVLPVKLDVTRTSTHGSDDRIHELRQTVEQQRVFFFFFQRQYDSCQLQGGLQPTCMTLTLPLNHRR